jgi:hypothetical protein
MMPVPACRILQEPGASVSLFTVKRKIMGALMVVHELNAWCAVYRATEGEGIGRQNRRQHLFIVPIIAGLHLQTTPRFSCPGMSPSARGAWLSSVVARVEAVEVSMR